MFFNLFCEQVRASLSLTLLVAIANLYQPGRDRVTRRRREAANPFVTASLKRRRGWN